MDFPTHLRLSVAQKVLLTQCLGLHPSCRGVAGPVIPPKSARTAAERLVEKGAVEWVDVLDSRGVPCRAIVVVPFKEKTDGSNETF